MLFYYLYISIHIYVHIYIYIHKYTCRIRTYLFLAVVYAACIPPYQMTTIQEALGRRPIFRKCSRTQGWPVQQTSSFSDIFWGATYYYFCIKKDGTQWSNRVLLSIKQILRGYTKWEIEVTAAVSHLYHTSFFFHLSFPFIFPTIL